MAEPFGEGLDLVVRSEALLLLDQHAVAVGPIVRMAVVALPGYLRRRGAPSAPEELHAHDGVCLRAADAVAPDISDGRLVELLPGRAATLPPFRLAYLSKRHVRPVVRAFVDLARARRGVW